jgi:hypothetical protein
MVSTALPGIVTLSVRVTLLPWNVPMLPTNEMPEVYIAFVLKLDANSTPPPSILNVENLPISEVPPCAVTVPPFMARVPHLSVPSKPWVAPIAFTVPPLMVIVSARIPGRLPLEAFTKPPFMVTVPEALRLPMPGPPTPPMALTVPLFMMIVPTLIGMPIPNVGSKLPIPAALLLPPVTFKVPVPFIVSLAFSGTKMPGVTSFEDSVFVPISVRVTLAPGERPNGYRSL